MSSILPHYPHLALPASCCTRNRCHSYPWFSALLYTACWVPPRRPDLLGACSWRLPWASSFAARSPEVCWSTHLWIALWATIGPSSRSWKDGKYGRPCLFQLQALRANRYLWLVWWLMIGKGSTCKTDRQASGSHPSNRKLALRSAHRDHPPMSFNRGSLWGSCASWLPFYSNTQPLYPVNSSVPTLIIFCSFCLLELRVGLASLSEGIKLFEAQILNDSAHKTRW